MVNGQAGKGSRPRPVNEKKYSEGYDRAFGRKNEEVNEDNKDKENNDE